MTKTYVLSDIHIGTNYRTCWYQQGYHEPYLIAVLDEIIRNKANIDECILLAACRRGNFSTKNKPFLTMDLIVWVINWA